MKQQQQLATSTVEEETLSKHWGDYKGNIVMVIGNKIFATKRAAKVDKMLKEIEQKYQQQPLITYIPKEGTWIL